MTYSTEVFDSEGTLAIKRGDQDILHVVRVDEQTMHDPGAEAGWHPMTEREHQALIVKIAGLFGAPEDAHTDADGKYHNPDGRVYWGEYEEAEKLSGRGMYYVTESPEDPSLNPCWFGVADNPVDALNRYCVAAGFSGYAASDMRDQVGIWADAQSDGNPAGAWATFTNTTIYSGLADSVVPDRTVLVHFNLTLLESDTRTAEAVIAAMSNAVDFVAENGMPEESFGWGVNFKNIEVSGEEI